MSGVEVATVSRVMEAVLVGEGRPIVYYDQATNTDVPISPAAAASPRGLLPALVVAAEAVWREATGKGFALDIVRDRDAMLGYRLQGIGAGTFSTVMLTTMEATAQVASSGPILISDLSAVWSAATNRIERAALAAPSPSSGAAP